MSVCGKGNCFGCPALNYIDGQLEQSQSAREIFLEEAIDVMGLAEKIENLSDAALLKDYEARIAARKNECEDVLANLDHADVVLEQSRVELTEACPSGKPYITYETGLLGRRVLHCASEIAPDLAERISSAVLPDAE